MEKEKTINSISKELCLRLANTYFEYVAKYNKVTNKTSFIYNYQLFMEKSLVPVRNAVTYLIEHGYIINNADVLTIASSIADDFFKIFDSDDHFLLYGESSAFIEEYIDVFVRSVEKAESFLIEMERRDISTSTNATRLSLNMLGNYYQSSNHIQKSAFAFNNTSVEFINDLFDTLGEIYPESAYLLESFHNTGGQR